MPSQPPKLRLVKTFRVTSKRFYRKGESPRTERPTPGLDDRVNEWVRDTGNIIISATPGQQTYMEKGAGGALIKKTVQLLAVIYQSPPLVLQEKPVVVQASPQRISDNPETPPVSPDAGGPADFIDLPLEDDEDEL